MTTDDASLRRKHFASYTGVKLPLQLISPLDEDGLDQRITYFRGFYDTDARLVGVQKIVYGEIEFEHRYEYGDDGSIKQAKLLEPDEEPRILTFGD